MADLNDTLLAVRYAGIPELPDTGDAGDRQVQQALEREMTGNRSRRPAWTTRRIRAGGFAVAPVTALAVAATAAAATTAAVAISATSLFNRTRRRSPAPRQKRSSSDGETGRQREYPGLRHRRRVGSDNAAGRTLPRAEAARRHVGRPARHGDGQRPGSWLLHDPSADGREPRGCLTRPATNWRGAHAAGGVGRHGVIARDSPGTSTSGMSKRKAPPRPSAAPSRA